MGAFFHPSEEPGVKRAKRSGATLIPGSSDGTLCAAIAEQMSGGARSLRRKTLSLSPPCGWVHFKLPKWVKSKLALTTCSRTDRPGSQHSLRLQEGKEGFTILVVPISSTDDPSSQYRLTEEQEDGTGTHDPPSLRSRFPLFSEKIP